MIEEEIVSRIRDEDFEDEKRPAEANSKDRRFGDFDCPSCNANNPYDDKFGDGDEIRCYYCGGEFRALVDDTGRLRLKEV